MIYAQLFVYNFAAFGIAYVLGYSAIFHPLRVLLDPGVIGDPRKAGIARNITWALRTFTLALIECPACLGFWIGVACAGYFMEDTVVLSDDHRLAARVFFGFFTCGINFMLGRATGLIKD